MLASAIRLALEAIRRNPVRSFLTVLGVVIGVAAVITMVTLGNGASRAVKEQISSLGSNLIVIHPGQRLGMGGLRARQFKASEVQAMRAQVTGVESVSGIEATSATVVYRSQNWSTTVAGVETDYFAARQLTLAGGRAFNDAEQRAGRPVCVLGETVRRKLYGAANALGTRMRVKAFACEVIGVLTSTGQATLGMDQDDLVLMPLKTVQRRISGSNDIGEVLLSVRTQDDIEPAKADLVQLLRDRRHIARNEDDDFNVMDTRQIADTLAGTTRILTMLLGAVAAVSLLVGGIGIMNIMLVSVTERTREIGIRLAIGALEGDVLLQFLVEAVTLSLFGGIVGIAIAAGAAQGLSKVMGLPYAFEPVINLVAFCVSAAIGVTFGFFPARRAARMDPIEALRHE